MSFQNSIRARIQDLENDDRGSKKNNLIIDELTGLDVCLDIQISKQIRRQETDEQIKDLNEKIENKKPI